MLHSRVEEWRHGVEQGPLSDTTSDLWKCPFSLETSREEDGRFMGMSQMAKLCRTQQRFSLYSTERNRHLRSEFTGTNSHQRRVKVDGFDLMSSI